MPPVTLERRLSKVEEALEKHLLESGEIRTDLAWLKKAFWTLVAICGADVASHILRG